jgi:alpha-D-xyloside xylohydrolase
MLPAWSYGLWLTTSFTTNYDEETVTGSLEGMKERSIPLEVFHYDCFWMRAFHWCDFVFSKEHFPDPKGSIGRLKGANLLKKVCIWINPYIGQASPVFTYAAEKGYLVKRTNGDVWQWDLWQAGMGLVDFTNSEACKWYKDCLNSLFDQGIDCLKTDFGERIPSKDVVWHDKTMDPSRMHNFYAFLFNKLCYEALEKRHGPSQAVLFARTATAGTQRFPLCWGGDCESTPAALAESIRGGLSIGLSGFSFWSCDIGGFEGSPAPWVYKRWVAFGLLCSHSRLHGSNSYRVPWLIDNNATGPESATGVLRTFVRLKRRLMPYIFAQAKQSAENGWPLSLRAMCLEFPEDPTSWFLDRQFMFGSQILIAPVFAEEGDVEFYLPAGTWTNWWNGSIVVGPGWRKERHGFGSLPVYVREGTVMVLGQEEGKKGEGFEYDWFNTGGEVGLFNVKEGDGMELVDCKGTYLGKVELGKNGKLVGLQLLRGEWKVEDQADG